MRHLLLLWLLSGAAGAIEPLAVREGQFVTPAGRPVGLFGANLYQSHMMWARLQDPAPGRAALQAMARAGFNCARLPLSAGYLMPAEGVLPDHRDYAAKLTERGLKAGYVALLDELLSEAERQGLWLLAEIHEYPRDPYRWFTGGDERKRQTGEPGGGLDWMKDEATIRQHTPAILGWLAAHWRGRPGLLGIEVPHNEPHGDGEWASGPGLKAFAGDCARAVKAADPTRLCILAVGDWGAGVNRLDDSFVWDLPPEVDALTPHFYFGMHNNQSSLANAYAVAAASWLSWYRGSGRPIVVGEWGNAHADYPRYQRFDPSDRITQRLTDACLAGWLINGVQGTLRWAWDGGIDDPAKQDRLGPQAAAMLKYAAPAIERPAGAGRVAIVLAPSRRAPFGADRDLTRLAAALLDLGVTPFDCLFANQVKARPEDLRRYRQVLVYRPDLPAEVLAAVEAAGVRSLVLTDDDIDRAALRAWFAAGGVECLPDPPAVWLFETAERLALFNRTGEPATLAPAVAAGQRLVDRLTGDEIPVVEGRARVDLPAFGGRDLQRLPAGGQPDQLPLVAGRTRPTPLPPNVPLYDHGPRRGRWVAGWAGGEAVLQRSPEGQEIIAVSSANAQQLGGFNFNRHEPLELTRWLEEPGARLVLKLRLTSRGQAALQVRLNGEPDGAVATRAVLPGGDWQLVELPLDSFRPPGRPATLTGVLLGLIPAGSAELGGAWLTRPPD